MQRRTALKLIGLAIAGPTLIVKEQRLIGKTFAGERIPTCFPRIDEAMGGGIKPGEVMGISGNESSLLLKSLAVRFSHSEANVALVTTNKRREACGDDPLLQGQDLTIWDMDQEISFFDQWKMLTEFHDVVVVESFCNNHGTQGEHKNFLSVARNNECALVIRSPYVWTPDGTENPCREVLLSPYFKVPAYARFPMMEYIDVFRCDYTLALKETKLEVRRFNERKEIKQLWLLKNRNGVQSALMELVTSNHQGFANASELYPAHQVYDHREVAKHAT